MHLAARTHARMEAVRRSGGVERFADAHDSRFRRLASIFKRPLRHLSRNAIENFAAAGAPYRRRTSLALPSPHSRILGAAQNNRPAARRFSESANRPDRRLDRPQRGNCQIETRGPCGVRMGEAVRRVTCWVTKGNRMADEVQPEIEKVEAPAEPPAEAANVEVAPETPKAAAPVDAPAKPPVNLEAW